MRAKAIKLKLKLRLKRKRRIRARISGSVALPRISVFRSNRSLYLQAIDDAAGHTLASASGAKLGIRANKEGARKIAEEFAATLKAKKIDQALFDRNGYLYHGVVAALAEGLREKGIKI